MLELSVMTSVKNFIQFAVVFVFASNQLVIGQVLPKSDSENNNSVKLENKELKNQLDSLFQNKSFFKFRRLFKREKHALSKIDSLIFESKIQSTINQSSSSNSCIKTLLSNNYFQLNNTEKLDLLRIQQQNHIKQFQYFLAANVTLQLLTEYGDQLDSVEKNELQNEFQIWNGLKNVAAQRVLKKESTEIQFIDESRIPVFLNGSDSSVNLTFDTGANISVITKSIAQAKGFKFIDASCNVKSILGDEMKVEIALSPQLNFGNILLENVVFLVFPDSALYFPEANFQINGLIGYPVISALGEIQLTKDGKLIVPSKSTKISYSNLVMDFLTPVLEVINKKDSLVFTFDTGANQTWLYKKYYEENKDNIDGHYNKVPFKLGGVSGSTENTGHLIDFSIRFEETELVLHKTKLLLNDSNNLHKNYYGNIGQDVIKSFDNVIINFEHMFVTFKVY